MYFLVRSTVFNAITGVHGLPYRFLRSFLLLAGNLSPEEGFRISRNDDNGHNDATACKNSLVSFRPLSADF
jgi:hypothetical protein